MIRRVNCGDPALLIEIMKTIPFGTIDLPAEEAVLDLKPVADGWSPIQLRKLTLTPTP